MKKIFATLMLACTFAVAASAQVTITTKKVKLSDFPSKTTKVVLTGSSLIDENLKEEVSRNWRISPYEFCTLDEYQKLKTSTDYYFLAVMDSQTKKETEPGICVLTVFRGGNEEAATDEGKPLDVVSLPFASAGQTSGREFTFLAPLLDIIQRYIDDSMTSDRVAYAGLGYYSKKYLKAKDMIMYFAQEDLAEGLEPSTEWQSKRIIVKDADSVDEILTSGTANALVSYTVYPNDIQKGSVCYKYLICATTHELYYFDKHNINNGNPAGFTDKDMKLFSLVRK